MRMISPTELTRLHQALVVDIAASPREVLDPPAVGLRSGALRGG